MAISVNIPNVNPVTFAWPQTFALPQTVSYAGVQAIAGSMVSSAEDFMDQLGNAGWFVAPTINPKFPDLASAPSTSALAAPNLRDPSWVVPAAPAAFTTQAPDISKLLPGPFTGAAPIPVFGSAPLPDFGSAPVSPSIDLNFTYPTLSINIPAAPSLMSVGVVPFGGVTLPTFNAAAPILTVASPNILAYGPETIFVSTLLTSLENDLNTALTTGQGLVVGGQVEEALWDSAREREYRQQGDALADLDRMEALGYALPPGVWVDARLKIQTETNNTIAGLSREIMVQQAKDLLENLKQARQISTDLEAKQMDYANQVAQRSFESCKMVAELGVQVYNANVEAYKANIQSFQAQAQVFDTLMRGAQTSVDIYKSEIEAEKIKVDMNSAVVQQYSELIKAQGLFVDIYKAELGAIETQANLQKTVVEAYSAQIQAFIGRVNAYSSEVEAYKAQLEAQQTISNIFKTQVDAYTATVQAGASEATATIEGYKAEISGYTARLDAYRAAILSMGEQAKAGAEYNQAAADVYRSEVQAYVGYANILTEQWKAQAEIQEKEAEVAIKAAEAQGQMYIATKNVAIEALKGGAQVAAQIGSAALNAIHWSESNSFSSGASMSMSQAVSVGYSASESISESVSASG